jgi:diguanylate cyclase
VLVLTYAHLFAQALQIPIMPSQAALRRPKPVSVQPERPDKSTSVPASGSYRDRINALAQRIRGTDDVSAIIGMLNQALTETRRLRARDEELHESKRKVAEAERSIEAMRNELEQVKALLHQDPLTGMLNRRGIDDAFRQETSRCERRGTGLCVALLDLDDFKSINDSFGHSCGDKALVHVAKVIRESLRPTDRMGRFGGEEFLILLPETALRESAGVLARIKRELASNPVDEKDASFKVTFSGGVAERTRGESLEQVLARADAALYRAKNAGKNRITLAR